MTDFVAPHAGAWIETYDTHLLQKKANVAPHAGAWIETYMLINIQQFAFVAPHAGAWIETLFILAIKFPPLSRPMRARGLKPHVCGEHLIQHVVAPHAGAWIETRRNTQHISYVACRAPCGRVD